MAKTNSFRQWLREHEKLSEGKAKKASGPPPPRRLIIVGYDKHEGRDYSAVHKLFKMAGGRDVLDSTWLFKTKLRAIEMRKGIESLFEADEHILVAQLGELSHRLDPKDEKWIGDP